MCEDGLYIGKNVVVVIDGATAQSNKMFFGKSSGRFARDILLEVAEQQEDLLCRMSATEALAFLNDKLGKSLRESLSIEEYPRASVMIYNDRKHEIWGYGDCQCMINGELYNFEKEIDRINSEKRAQTIEGALGNKISVEKLLFHDVGRDAIEEGLKGRFTYENQPGPLGYPTLNGYSFYEPFVFVKHVEGNSDIILATDGYPVLKNSLQESEKELARILVSDPLCFREFKSTKGLTQGSLSFDDRTYWRGLV
ncbi:glycerophosphoryl diester phosphodiesterase [[Clostridium] aminophilum]|uniref:Glycerophosphoryl diester phosphodiesterase n=1 Tax=[Clostridium] aminophilum TaxID=1526 RepID=A0A1I0GK41_9FIRM|nr:glycerophosphoryl diester phosphodiesterase [[Clostridium] aminophilum]